MHSVPIGNPFPRVILRDARDARDARGIRDECDERRESGDARALIRDAGMPRRSVAALAVCCACARLAASAYAETHVRRAICTLAAGSPPPEMR
ncbi:hypothetical protein [Paraburkholderia tagetis]|uniref:Uncharacterized protein n=1 Tax=Paraburkholderia tagetis TaxID=2913261 RepID=A0A9X1UGR3_9BURK|nr:hypothetical protein [Paraburkholderia tagetis]MCG5073298.1 hypothetical protein [Paraburkholderia tagetis]